MMTPPPRRTRCGNACFAHGKGPRKLMAIVRSQSSARRPRARPRRRSDASRPSLRRSRVVAVHGRQARGVKSEPVNVSAHAEAAPARAPALLPLARALAHQRLQLRDRLLDLRLPPAARRDAAVGLLELAERLLQLAAQPRGERQVVEALGLVALPPEGEAGQAMRFFGIGVEAQRTLELGER